MGGVQKFDYLAEVFAKSWPTGKELQLPDLLGLVLVTVSKLRGSAGVVCCVSIVGRPRRHALH